MTNYKITFTTATGTTDTISYSADTFSDLMIWLFGYKREHEMSDEISIMIV